MILVTTTIAITNAGSLTPFTSQQCHACWTITAHKTLTVKMALHCLRTLKKSCILTQSNYSPLKKVLKAINKRSKKKKKMESVGKWGLLKISSHHV